MNKSNIFLFLLIPFLALGQETINDTISHDDLERDYILYVPDSYDASSSTPLVFNFHGYSSNAVQQMWYGDFRSIADDKGFIVVHPNGTLDDNGITHWNVGWGDSTVDDIGFTDALIDSIAEEYNIDLDRIYSTGMSNGGFMSYHLACQLSGRIAAIASVTGSMNIGWFNSCNSTHPMPIMEIHGTADPTVPYTASSFTESISDIMDFWVNYNNCNPEAITTAVADIDNTDGCTAEHSIWANGDNGVAVELYKIIDGEHSWPGAFFLNGITNQDIDASEKIWEFFSRYDLNGVVEATAIHQEDTTTSRLLKITNLLGQTVTIQKNTPLFFIYEDGRVEKKIIFE